MHGYNTHFKSDFRRKKCVLYVRILWYFISGRSFALTSKLRLLLLPIYLTRSTQEYFSHLMMTKSEMLVGNPGVAGRLSHMEPERNT